MIKNLTLPVIALMLLHNLASGQTIKRYCLGEWCEKIGYSEAVAVGHTLYLSGIVAETDTMEESLSIALERLDSILNFFQLEKQNILKEKIYTNDKNAVRGATDIRKEFYGKHLPAAIWIETEKERQKAWVEIEYVIHIPSGHELPAPQ